MSRTLKYAMLAVLGCAMFTMEMPQAEARRRVVIRPGYRRVVTPNYRRTVRYDYSPRRYNNYYNRGYNNRSWNRGNGVYINGRGWGIGFGF